MFKYLLASPLMALQPHMMVAEAVQNCKVDGQMVPCGPLLENL
jgi:hypothetical protein